MAPPGRSRPEVLHRFVKAYNKSDIAELEAVLSPSVTYKQTERKAALSGRDNVIDALLRENREHMDSDPLQCAVCYPVNHKWTGQDPVFIIQGYNEDWGGGYQGECTIVDGYIALIDHQIDLNAVNGVYNEQW